MNPYEEPLKECPYCERDMYTDWVDVGVGIVQCAPYHCTNCGASEIGLELYDWCYEDREGNTIYLDAPRKYYKFLGEKARCTDYSRYVLKPGAPFSEIELETGFYNTGEISPYANTVGGKLVDHETAKEAYRVGMLDDKNI